MQNTGMMHNQSLYRVIELTHIPAGSWLLHGATVPRDATVAAALRKAGAILLGKTNMSQWANWRIDGGCNGWSSHGGQVVAAYLDRQDPLGSSSGSGVAADMCFAAATLGTETDGSIICPAACSNTVGLKPTVGLTSRSLVIPICERQDSVGPMAGSIRDAVMVLQAIAGRDDRDKYTLEAPSPLPDYLGCCKEGSLRGARIGVPWKLINKAVEEDKTASSQNELAVFNDALDVLREHGADIIEANFEVTAEERWEAERIIMHADFPVNLAAYLKELESNPHDIHTLAQVREKTHADNREDYPEHGTSVWDFALDELGFDNTDEEKFGEALRKYKQLGEEKGLPAILAEHNLDAVVLPTMSAPGWAAVIGGPAITVPMGCHPPSSPIKVSDWGLVELGPGIPIGLSFLGPRWSEPTLIGLAYDFEQKTKWRDQVLEGRPDRTSKRQQPSS